MKKALIVVAILLCFTAFAVSCGTVNINGGVNVNATVDANINNHATGDNVLDWNDIIGGTTAAKTTAVKTTVTKATGGATATTGKSTTVAATTKQPSTQHTWTVATDDPNGGWGPLNPLG